jgi:hypothetical protein
MTETIELRNKPELKFILNADEFDILDASDPKNSGTYSYSELKSTELNEERTNWLLSTLSIIVDLITGGYGSGKLKEKANLKLEMKNLNLKVWLIDADFEKAKRVTELINSKKTYTQQSTVAKNK